MQQLNVQPRPCFSQLEGEAYYRTLFEAASDCILVLGEDGRMLDLNHRTCRLLGYGREELLGVAYTRVLSSKSLIRIYPRPAHIRVERRSVRGDEELRARDGSLRYVEFVASPLPDGRVLLVVRDETDRRLRDAERLAQNRLLEQRVAERTTELMALYQELDSFSYSVSHDLRAPLRNIQGLARMLRGGSAQPTPEDTDYCLERIDSNLRRMETIIDSLLVLSRSCQGLERVAAVDMRELVEAVIPEQREEPRREVSVALGAMPVCSGDADLLRQVWTNLIGNAFKYTARVDQPQIDIGGADRGDVLEYWVKDNGAGFDAGAASGLFSAFCRLHAEHEYPGTGIGLATVKRIVERHGGSVSATGEVGRGAVFRFTLPKVVQGAQVR